MLAGERGLHPGLDAAGSGASLQSLDVADALSTLTPQQFRVASMLVEGLLNKQIAYELEVKEATIKAHMTEIYRKLGVQSRTQAVLALSSLAVELTVYSMLFWIASGIWLWWEIKPARVWGAVFALVGIGLFAVMFLII